MNALNILLVGYYGRGNFGDDLLLYITFRLIKKTLPNAAITVISNSNDSDYIHRILDGVNIVKTARHGHFDFIVHGGGGVFFDFKTGGFLAILFERIMQMIGMRHLVAGEKMLRSIIRKPRTSTTCRVGLGIGVGSYAPGSKRLRQSLPILADFKALWLRDPQSVKNLSRFHTVMRADIIHGSDLAFLTEYWVPKITVTEKSTKPRIGIAFRDWEGHSISPALIAKLSANYDITGFILDEYTDPITQQLFTEYPMHVWNPKTMRLADFATALGTQDVMLTSRAHGAICSACMGVASVIVNIEPKLEQVHTMLPNASILVATHAPETWIAAIEKARTISRDTILADVAANQNKSTQAWHTIQRWLA